MWNDLSEQIWLDNKVTDWILCLTILVAGLTLKRFLSRIISRLIYGFIRKYAKGVRVEKLYVLVRKPMNWTFILATLYFAFDRLHFPYQWDIAPVERFGMRLIMLRTFQLAFCVSVTWIVLRFLDFAGNVFSHRATFTESQADDQLVPFVRDALKIVVCIISFFFILGNIFKMDITSLIAGLGLGGLAIALAAKDTIENLLGSFAIFLDKPFLQGDVVKVGLTIGTVQKIGFRSTQIRTFDQTIVTMPNKKMVDAELENLSHRTLFRVNLNLQLSGEVSSERLRSVVAEITAIVARKPEVQKESIHVNFFDFGFGTFTLTIMYLVQVGDWNLYVKVKEEINFIIIDILHKNECRLAVPLARI